MRRVLLYLAIVAEPICHLLGIPHPEGLASLALSYMNEELE